MELVVDANIVFSALVKRGFSFDVLMSMKGKGIALCSPQYLRTELRKKRGRLLEYSKLEPEELDTLLELVLERIKVIPSSQYKPFIQEAKSLTTDKKDVAYFALALKLGCPVWSDEKLFRQQPKVMVLSTQEASWLEV